jgi:hypothetical protein
MCYKVWRAVIDKVGQKALALLEYCRHVPEGGVNVKGFHLSEKNAIKELIEAEVLNA